MLKFGAALHSIRLLPAPSVCNLEKFGSPRILAIFENTYVEWIVSVLEAFSQSLVVTTIYATLGMFLCDAWLD